MSSGYQDPVGGTSSPSTGTAIGSKPIRAMIRMFKNIDVSLESDFGLSFIPKIQTPWRFKSDRLWLDNPLQTFGTSFESAALLEDQYIKIPILEAEESDIKKDEVVFLKQTQAIKKKHIDINPASADENTIQDEDADTTHIAGFDADGKLIRVLKSSITVPPTSHSHPFTEISGTIALAQFADNIITGAKLLNDTIVDAKIGAHTSTKITITTKGQLNSQIAYKDESTWLTNAMVSASAAIAPSKLANGTDGQILTTVSGVPAWAAPAIQLSSFKYLIYKDGSTYYCKNNITGAIEVSNASPNTVLQFPLTNGGSCYVQGADYTLTGTPGVYLDFPVEPLYCHFQMAPDANIIVPNGYTGIVFRMRNSSSQHSTRNRLLGGCIKEAGSVVRDWLGVLLEAIGTTFKGVYDNAVEHLRILFPNIGIKLNNDATCTNGFVNVNIFDTVSIFGAKTAYVDWGMDIAYSAGVNGVHRNRFKNMILQSSNGTDASIGFKNVRHRENSFEFCYVVDFSGSNVAGITIHADATDTEIIGGTTDSYNYTDNSTAGSTKKLTATSGGIQVTRINPSNGNNLETVMGAASSTLTWSFWNPALSERFYVQKGASDYRFDFVRQTSGGALRPVLFRQLDVVGGGAGTLESFRIMTTGHLRVHTDMLQFLDSGGDHTYNIKTGNLAANRDITYPVLTGNDIPVFQAHSQAITNKTIDFSSNTGSNIGDSVIASHTSTKITITAKGQLNSAILYNDVDNALGAHYVTIDKISSPGSAPAGKLRIFADSSTGYLSQIDEAGVITDITAGTGGGGGGSGDVTGGSSLGAGVAVYKQENGSHVLEFKSFNSGSIVTFAANGDGNTIDSSIANGSIVDAQIGSHTSTKISITAKGQLNSAIVYNDAANVFGDFNQSFRSSRLRISNPANTFFYNWVGAAIAADRTINLPLLTGNDEPLFKDFAATITNKTINFSNNTGSNIGDSAISAHTSTKITITAKGQLNSAIVYNDQNNDLGAFYLDIGEIAAPSAPGSNKNRIYFDSTSHRPTWKDSANTVRALVSAPTYIGTSLQVLRTNNGVTATEWASLDNERVGRSTANGNGSATAFEITHGGTGVTSTTPCFVQCSSHAILITYTVDATKIYVTFASAPSSGTNNVVLHWTLKI